MNNSGLFLLFVETYSKCCSLLRSLSIRSSSSNIFPAISLMSGMFANGPGDWGSIPGQVITKTQKWYLMPLCLTLSIIR